MEPDDVGVRLERKGEAAVPDQKESDTSTTVFSLDPAGLRNLLAGQPELLGEGLSILADEKGKPVGAAYPTGVGDIDLLARDASGDLVVVMVTERDQGEELVAEILQRIGWVRKEAPRERGAKGARDRLGRAAPREP